MGGRKGVQHQGGVGLLAAALACVASCTEAPTRIVLVVDAEPTLTPQLQAVNVAMRREGVAEVGDAGHYSLDVYRLRAPDRDGLVELLPKDLSDTRGVFITVEGELRDGARVRFTALTHFERGQTLYLYVPLSAACVPVTCSAGTTCTNGRCEPVVARTLPQEPPSRSLLDATVQADMLERGDVFDEPYDLPKTDTSDDSLDRTPVEEMDASSVSDAGFDTVNENPINWGDAREEPAKVDVASELPLDDLGSITDSTPTDATIRDVSAVDIVKDASDVAIAPLDGSDVPAIDVTVADADVSANDAIDVLADLALVDVASPLRCPAGSDAIPAPPQQLTPFSATNVASRVPLFRRNLDDSVSETCIEVCRDRACTEIEVSWHAIGRAAVRPPTPLTQGVHYWRTSGLLAGTSRWSRFSPTWQFKVAPWTRESDSSWGTMPDFNGDGLVDFAYVSGDRSVAWVLSQTAGAFSSPNVVSSFAESISSIDLGDFNGDGFADLGVFFLTGYQYLAGSSSGLVSTPSSRVSISAPAGPGPYRSATVGDIDHDGRSDILSVFSFYAPVELILSSGMRISASGALTTVSCGTGVSGFGSALAGNFDLEGNGEPNFVIGGTMLCSTTQNLYDGLPYWRAGTTVFTGVATIHCPVRCGFAGDMNADGVADLWQYDGASVYVNYSPRLLPPTSVRVFRSGTASFGTSVLGASDFNSDGISDLAVSSPMSLGGAGRVDIYLGGTSVDSTSMFLYGDTVTENVGLAMAGGGSADPDRFDDLFVVEAGQFMGTSQVRVIRGSLSFSMSALTEEAVLPVGAPPFLRPADPRVAAFLPYSNSSVRRRLSAEAIPRSNSTSK